MTYLSLLPAEIQDLVVRLPFRVGLYISESDQTGGDESAEAERKALENIVTFYVEDTVKSEFAHEVMLQTLNLKSKWGGWGKDITKVPEECWAVVKAMAGIVPEKEIMALKHNLLEVGITVAQAYCEFDESASTLNKIEVYVAIFLRKLQAIFGGEPALSGDSSLNISPAERSAIKLLADTMGISVKI